MSAASQPSHEARPLVLYQDYSRHDAHDIFDRHSPFASQRGTWGILGLIELPERPGDFVFFVTFGQRQGEHQFDEGITAQGVFRWQSQPSQDHTDQRVQRLITHDPDRNSVHLFLRTAERRHGEIVPYTYLGRLKYDGHDRERTKPVHFRWTLIDWPMPVAVATRIGLRLEDESVAPDGSFDPPLLAPADTAGELVEEDPPPITAEMVEGETTQAFRAVRRRRPTEAETQALGLAGERLVVRRERRHLLAAGRADLAEKVVHTALIEGDGAGFDISSFFSDGRLKFVEVKTTSGPKDTEFLISANEVRFSAIHPDNYELCRVFLYNVELNTGRCYSLLGDITKHLKLFATEYRAKL